MLITALTICISSCTKRYADLPPLTETFYRNDNEPFGASVFHDQLARLYSHNNINISENNFSATWNQMNGTSEEEDTGSLYICISKHLYLSSSDKDAMMNFVNAGNSMFISCEDIDSVLLSELECKVHIDSIPDDVWFYPGYLNYTVEKIDPYNEALSQYGYFYYPFNNYFSAFDTTTTHVLGKNEDGHPDFILIFYGKGRFYLHCEPRAFSNYFLLQKDNFQYLQNAFSLTSPIPQHVFWDDHYYKHNYRDSKDDDLAGEKSIFPWILIVILLIYILFNGKRRQRVIREIPPNTNSTTAFAETMGRLYYYEKNNKNIADKMVTYLLEQIRNQYFINTSQLNDAFAETLSRKSSVQKDIVDNLVKMMVNIQQSMEVSNKEILALNKQIEKFHKNKK